MKQIRHLLEAVTIELPVIFYNFKLFQSLNYFLNYYTGLQAGYQLAALGLTLGLAIVSGALTGFVLKLPFIDQVKEKEEMFEDHLFWETPSDYALTVTEVTENN